MQHPITSLRGGSNVFIYLITKMMYLTQAGDIKCLVVLFIHLILITNSRNNGQIWCPLGFSPGSSPLIPIYIRSTFQIYLTRQLVTSVLMMCRRLSVVNPLISSLLLAALMLFLSRFSSLKEPFEVLYKCPITIMITITV